MWLWLILVIAVVAFLLLGLVWWGVKRGLMLALNAVIGFFALYGVQAWWLHDLGINWVSVLLVLILHFLGAAF